jgi:hypothetical protein
MTLPRQPEREDVPQSEWADYDDVVATRSAYARTADGRADPFYGALLNSPPLARLLNDLSRYLIAGASRDSYTHAEREWVDLTLGRELQWRTGLYHHMSAAVAAGVRPAAIEALIEQRDDDLEPDERQLVEYVCSVVRDSVTDDAFSRLCDRFGTRGAVEYTILVCRLIMTQKAMTALGAENHGISDEQVCERLQGYLDGSTKIEDESERLALYAQRRIGP